MSPIVLVVEDEPLLRLALAEHLFSCGFEVREACNADEALALLRAPCCLINIVISDVRMPGHTDGLDLCCWIYENRPHIPVFLASADASKHAAIEALCGTQTIAKPYDFDSATTRILQRLSAQPLGQGDARPGSRERGG